MNFKCEITSNESNRFFKEFPVEFLLSVHETTKLKESTIKSCQNELDVFKNMTKFNIKHVFKILPTHFKIMSWFITALQI